MTDSDHVPHRCLALFERLSAYIDHELDDQERAQVEAHIQACDQCHICYETLQRTVALCRSSAEDFPLPESLADKLRAIIDAVGR